MTSKPYNFRGNNIAFCQGCLSKFNLIRRRYHCRSCEKIFCSKCSQNQIRIIATNNIKERVCDDCYSKLIAQTTTTAIIKNTNMKTQNKISDISTSFKYKQDIVTVIQSWNQWKTYEMSALWKLKTQKEDTEIHIHSPLGDDVIIKSELIFPVPTSTVLDVLFNPFHTKKWDHSLDELIVIEKYFNYCYSMYISMKTPMFITSRDMTIIQFIYPLQNGSYLMCCKSINSDKYLPKQDKIRATVKLNYWHISPMSISNRCKVTCYSQMSLGGSLPQRAQDHILIDVIGTKLLHCKKYINSLVHCNTKYKPPSISDIDQNIAVFMNKLQISNTEKAYKSNDLSNNQNTVHKRHKSKNNTTNLSPKIKSSEKQQHKKPANTCIAIF
eukprot:368145_1